MKDLTLPHRLKKRLIVGGASLSGQQGGYDIGAMTPDQTSQLLDFLLHQGLTQFDTAPIYGFGHSENLIGLASQKVPLSVTSKGGVTWDKSKRVSVNSSADILKKMSQESTDRLGNALHNYLIHHLDHYHDLEATLFYLESLKNQGRVKKIGISDITLTDYLKIKKYICLDIVQLPFHPFIDLQEYQEFRDRLFEDGVSIQLFGIFSHGYACHDDNKLFQPKDIRFWAPWMKKFQSQKHSQIDQWQEKVHKEGKTYSQACLERVLSHTEKESLILGGSSIKQWKENLRFLIENHPV